jgi:hypothetical protein
MRRDMPVTVEGLRHDLTLPQARIESMQKRGATFIICNNALTLFSPLLARARNLSPDAVCAALKASILRG